MIYQFSYWSFNSLFEIHSIFGDGSDGDVTLTENTVLNRDMYYNNLTIPEGIVLYTAGHRIFVRGKLTIAGKISGASLFSWKFYPTPLGVGGAGSDEEDRKGEYGGNAGGEDTVLHFVPRAYIPYETRGQLRGPFSEATDIDALKEDIIRFFEPPRGGGGTSEVMGTTSKDCVADAYVDRGSSSTNYGSSSELKLEKDWKKIYIKFDLPSPNEEYHIIKAEIRLYQFYYEKNYDYYVYAHRILEDWDENSITWNNRPSIASEYTSCERWTFKNDEWKSIDVAKDVVPMMLGKIDNYGWALKTTQSYEYKFYSREHSDNRPHLKITGAIAGGGVVHIYAKEIEAQEGNKIESKGKNGGGKAGGGGGFIQIITNKITGTLNLDVTGGSGSPAGSPGRTVIITPPA